MSSFHDEHDEIYTLFSITNVAKQLDDGKKALPSLTNIRVAVHVLKIPYKKLGIAVCKVGTL